MSLMELLGARAQRKLVTIGSVPLRPEHENQHVMLVGSTGSGKSTATEEMLDTVVGRGDRCVIVDANGHYLERFHRPGDVIVNPWDRRSPGWCLFNEMHDVYDADRLARSVIPDGVGEDRSWNGYAQVLLSEVLQMLYRERGDALPSTSTLLHWATRAESAHLKDRLEGTPAIGLFMAGAERALASTRFIVTRHLNAHKHVPRGSFSMRRWLRDEGGNMYLTWRSDQLAALQPLLGTWLEVLIQEILNSPPEPGRRTWLVLEELGALPQLRLEAAVTLGRKHGLACVAALQSCAQLERIYGREAATVLRSCFRTLVALGIAATDPDTAETISRSLGEHEIERSLEGRSVGHHGLTKSETVQRVRERLVLPGELTQLPDLHGYVVMPGKNSVQRISMTHYERSCVAPGYEPRSAC